MKRWFLSLLLVTSQSWAAFTLAVTVPGTGSGSTTVFPPSIIATVPNQTQAPNTTLTLDGQTYIKAQTSHESTVNNPQWQLINNPDPARITINPLNGVVTVTNPVASAPNLQIRATNNSGTITSNAFAWNLSGAGIVASGYFLDCSAGSDLATGTSQAAPWRNLSKVNNTVSITGSDVWIKAGTTCTGQLVGDWSGTAGDHAKVGTYYVNAGVAYELLPDNPTAAPTAYTFSNGARAIIRGTYDNTCSWTLGGRLGTFQSSCAIGQVSGSYAGNTGGTSGANGSAIPTTTNVGLVSVQCNYCDLQSLDIKYSAGMGIQIVRTVSSGFTNAQVYHDHRLLYNNVNQFAGTGIDVQASRNDYVFGNIVRLCCVAGNSGSDAYYQDHAAGALIGTFLTSMVGAMLDANQLWENNDFYNNYGEGIIIETLGQVIIRGNRFSGHTDVSMYVAQCINCVVEYNIMTGGNGFSATANQEYGIGVADEAENGVPYQDTVAIIRGNMVANASNCILVSAEPDLILHNKKFTVYAYDNTCVNTTSGITVDSAITAANVGAGGIHFRNNIFWNESTTVGCVSPAVANVDWNFNYWKATPADTDCRGANDVSGNVLLTKTSGWNTANVYATLPTTADFMPQAGSPALAIGQNLFTTTLLSTANYPQFGSVTVGQGVACVTFDLKGFAIDAKCRAVDASPDAGAVGR